MSSEFLILAEEDVESGGKECKQNGVENDFAYNNNVSSADINIRMGFLRKVYGLLSIQLLMTFAVCTMFMVSDDVKLFVRNNSWTAGVAFFLNIGILFGLIFKRREHPTNLVLLGAFTLAISYTVGLVVSTLETSVVLEALFITLTILLGLTTYTFQSKRDFSFLGVGLFAGLWVLLLGGILQIFLQNTALEMAIGIGGSLIFCLFIVYDTHAIMRTLSPEEYILATINLYLDIINLFLYILRALSAARK